MRGLKKRALLFLSAISSAVAVGMILHNIPSTSLDKTVSSKISVDTLLGYPAPIRKNDPEIKSRSSLKPPPTIFTAENETRDSGGPRYGSSQSQKDSDYVEKNNNANGSSDEFDANNSEAKKLIERLELLKNKISRSKNPQQVVVLTEEIRDVLSNLDVYMTAILSQKIEAKFNRINNGYLIQYNAELQRIHADSQNMLDKIHSESERHIEQIRSSYSEKLTEMYQSWEFIFKVFGVFLGVATALSIAVSATCNVLTYRLSKTTLQLTAPKILTKQDHHIAEQPEAGGLQTQMVLEHRT